MDEKRWHRSLWLLQLALAAIFGVGGAATMLVSIDVLDGWLGWPGDFHPIAVRVIGALQIVAALLLVVPAATHRRPSWSAVAAFALGMWTMLELFLLLLDWRLTWAAAAVVVGAAAFTVAWARLWKVPIAPRHRGRRVAVGEG